MKLIYCPKCHDVVKLCYDARTCLCGASNGHYINALDAVYGGPAVPLGFANSSLVKAVENQPEQGMGECFEAFVIPKSCPTLKREE
jgi:hypothetical protein